MNEHNTDILTTLARLKQSGFGSCDVISSDSKHPLTLRLLTAQTVHDTHIIRLLARWRKKHEFWFPAQFPVSIQRTKIWLEKKVIHEPDRLLFMIMVHGTYRGHVGLYRFDFDNNSCEIDNIVRGRIGRKGMMAQAIQLMMQWGRDTLGLTSYTLQTTSDNVRALALYARIGFVETKRVPLVYTKTSDGGQWDIAPVGYTKRIKRFDVYMTGEGKYYDNTKA